MALSPMMQQYVNTKKSYPDSILMYRMGDFYEMFFEDAEIASRDLDIVLTGRDCGLEERAPMCGVPYHSVDSYIARLVAKGHRVTLCEQIKDPNTGEVTGRQVVRMITPGTIVEDAMLDETRNNYLGAAYVHKNKVCMAYTDISTGELYLTDVYSMKDTKIATELYRFDPRELILNDEAAAHPVFASYTARLGNRCMTKVEDDRYFDTDVCREILEKQFRQPLADLHLPDGEVSVSTLGALFGYLQETQLRSLDHLNRIQYQYQAHSVELDATARRNLELTETMRNREKKGTLLWVLDDTKTAMGARLLRKYVENPLMDLHTIRRRQSAVEELTRRHGERRSLREALTSVNDMERLLTKLVYGTLNPRDFKAFESSFSVLPMIHELTDVFRAFDLVEIYRNIETFEKLRRLLADAIKDDPPVVIREGNFVRDGYDAQVDEFRNLLSNTQQVLADIEARERESTGIKTMKIGYNKVFGYYLEVSKNQVSLVPDTYIRRQTLTNGERYITEELKQVEEKLLHARENLIQREEEIYEQVVAALSEQMILIQDTAAHIAKLDVLCSLAEVAVRNRYVCPTVDDKDRIEIKDGRHPVVELLMQNDLFVPNDTDLNRANCTMAIITGPNMAGKSTYMRQVALIVLMAQMGSFVPASAATIGIVDKIFTRVGASDDLTTGQSTFMLEMNEVAYILDHATKQSLVIFDEIGRGTSTFDGMSIARAVLEYMVKKIGAKSLFATHYHELTSLEQALDGVKNFNVAAKKREKEIIFLRKIVPGAADESYGIDVARLAGIPTDVIGNAERILQELESEKPQRIAEKRESAPVEQFSLTAGLSEALIEELKEIDVTVLTPLEAMNRLYQIVTRAKEL